MTGINLTGWIAHACERDARLVLRWHRTYCAQGETPQASLLVEDDDRWPFFAVGDIVAYSRNIPQSMRTLSEMYPNSPSPKFFNLEECPSEPIWLVAAAGVRLEAPVGFTLAFAAGWSLVFAHKTAASMWIAGGDLVSE